MGEPVVEFFIKTEHVYEFAAYTASIHSILLILFCT